MRIHACVSPAELADWRAKSTAVGVPLSDLPRQKLEAERLEIEKTATHELQRLGETLAQMEQTTWGVTLREIDGVRFVVLPASALDHPPWRVGGRPAVMLSSE